MEGVMVEGQPPEISPAEYVGPSRRVSKVLLAAAASIAVFAAAALIANRPNDDLDATGRLNDVDLQEATPLGQAAFISPADLGRTFRDGVPPDDVVLARAAAATAAALPACAVLPSAGLVPPTTKAAAPEQVLAGLGGGLTHTVFVFATTEDASRAMDVIAGDVFPTCQLDLYDRLTPVGSPGVTSTSEAWDAPTIAPHGDRQVIIGQHSRYAGAFDGPSENHRVNAFVQVGRAISWVNPPYFAAADKPRVIVDKAINATASALESVFGG